MLACSPSPAHTRRADAVNNQIMPFGMKCRVTAVIEHVLQLRVLYLLYFPAFGAHKMMMVAAEPRCELILRTGATEIVSTQQACAHEQFEGVVDRCSAHVIALFLHAGKQIVGHEMAVEVHYAVKNREALGGLAQAASGEMLHQCCAGGHGIFVVGGHRNKITKFL